MFQVSRELRAQFPDEADYRKVRKRWETDNPIESGTVQDVVDHIAITSRSHRDHIVKVAGIEHVGLGSDFDGIGKTPRQLDDVSTYPVITQELLNRGYEARQIHLLMSGNILRVMRRAEEVARGLRHGN